MSITPNSAPSSAATPRILFVLFALLGLALYYVTCMPGVGWQDCAMFQYRVWRMDLKGELGLALSHPLYIFLAKGTTLLPLGDFAFRVNLFSALAAALTLGFCSVLLWRLTGSALAAVVGTVVLGVSHTFWLHAVIAEVYDLYALLLIIELLCVERFVDRRQPQWLILALLANGLNVSVHDLALLHAPAYLGLIVWSLRRQFIRPKHLLIAAIGFLAGAGLYLALIISAIAEGQPVLAALQEALMGRYYSEAVLATHFSVLQQFAKSLEYLLLNFPTPLLLLAPCAVYWGWKNPRQRWFILFAGCIWAIDYIFAFRYLVADAYKFFTPDYVILALLIGIAVPYVGKPSRAKTCVFVTLALMPIAVYEIAPSMLRRSGVSLGVSREIPFRDNFEYFIRPRKNGDDGARKFAQVALDQAGPDGVLITTGDSTLKNVLTYVRDVLHVQPNVVLTLGPDFNGLPPLLDATPEATRPIAQRGRAFVCSNNPSYQLNWILKDYELEPLGEPAGIIYRLKPRQ